MEQEDKKQNKLPKGILVITILSIISGVILLLMFFFSLILILPFGPTALLGPVFLLALGSSSLIAATGLYLRKGWAWTLQLVLAGFGAAGYLMNVTHGQFFSLIGIAIDAIIIYYLYTPKVRKIFGKGYRNYSNYKNSKEGSNDINNNRVNNKNKYKR